MSLPPMNPSGNPVTGSGNVAGRAQQPNARPLKAFRGGEAITAAMSAPTDRDKHCTVYGRDDRVEFVVRAPDGVTAFTIHYGRWVTGGPFADAGTELNGWLELGTVAVTGATAGELFRVPPFDTYTDHVGIYVTALTGVAIESFRFWSRGVP